MARGLTTAVKNELATQNIKPIFLVSIGFPTPINITNCTHALTSSVSGSSVTYSASGHLLKIGQVNETTTPIKNSLRIVLSGVDQTFISVVLGTNVIGDIVEIYRGFLDSSNALLADPFLLYYGTIDGISVTDNEDVSNVGLTVTSHWGAFEKVGGRTTSDNSQRRFFSSDKGMEFSAISVQDIEWGQQ
tara:strand:- start:2591 stop:3157 length:567 start_codon:yes stop_codon:yes gene_type:complete